MPMQDFMKESISQSPNINLSSPLVNVTSQLHLVLVQHTARQTGIHHGFGMLLWEG
jgi:hypothetical protein